LDPDSFVGLAPIREVLEIIVDARIHLQGWKYRIVEGKRREHHEDRNDRMAEHVVLEEKASTEII